MDGVQATQRIAALDLGTKVLVLTIHDEDEFLVPAMEAGAAGFLNKSAADTDLLGALEAVARGHSYLPRRAATLIARRKAIEASRNAKGSRRSRSGSARRLSCTPEASQPGRRRARCSSVPRPSRAISHAPSPN